MLYAEAGYAKASTFGSTAWHQQPLSFLIGPSWETSKFTIRGNYVRQSTSYMPLLGYFAGDRKGPYVEGHYRPIARVEFYGSASRYANNLEHNPDVASFSSSGYTIGASLVLPWRFSTSSSLTSLKLTEHEPNITAPIPSNNRQISVTVSRPISRQNLRFSLIDMRLNSNNQPQTQRFEEIEDTYSWKHFVLGGAIRGQNSETSSQSVNTLFFRGSVQANIKRLSVYAYSEKGHDLVNQSVFSTSSMTSTVLGFTAPLPKGWNLQFEAFKNQLLTSLNPENVFLFGNNGQGLNTQLSNVNQRSTYFKLGKRYTWGRLIDPGSTMQQYAASQAPLVGTIQGVVMEAAAEGRRPAPNVAILPDHNRVATTDQTGHYAFSDVAEGLHDLELNMQELPADYAPASTDAVHVAVLPRTQARSDFDVLRLGTLSGRVIAPKDVPVDQIVIRLAGKQLYTTPYNDGTFSFYNLAEGKYVLELDTTTIPEGYVLGSPERVEVTAASDASAPMVDFELRVKPQVEKPVRELFNQQIHVTAPGSGTGH